MLHSFMQNFNGTSHQDVMISKKHDVLIGITKQEAILIVFVMTQQFMDENPNTAIAVTKALIRAGKWLDEPSNRPKAVGILSMPDYVGADSAVIANSMTGTFEFEKGDKRAMPDFNVFYKYNATYPFYSDGIWFLTQMRRWGQIPETKPAEWYSETIKDVYRPDIWKKAAEKLVAEGKIPATIPL